MHTINVMKCPLAFAISLSCSTMAFSESNIHDHSQMEMLEIQQDYLAHEGHLSLSQENHIPTNTSTHDHKKEHGGQISSSAVLDQSWRSNFKGHSEFHSKNEFEIGTDENKIRVEIEAKKPTAEASEYNAKLLYSHMMSDFWDIQAGVIDQRERIEINDKEKSKDHFSAAFGLQGLAPYFIETSMYLSVGKHDYVAFNLEAERDILITQKLITQPYIELDTVLNDHSHHAEKTGLREASLGLEIRYEITKLVMPYLDIAYHYERETEWNDEQRTSKSEKDWMYGLGIKFKF